MNAALRDIAKQVAREPGVKAVALSQAPPIGGYSMIAMRIPGMDSLPSLSGDGPKVRNVDAAYWDVAGIRALQGRLFRSTDATGAPLVVVMNDAMARTMWPRGDALGQCVILYRTDLCRTVVGVVSDAHFSKLLEEPTMKMYVPLAQATTKGTGANAHAITVRADPQSLPQVAESLRASLNAALPNTDLYLQTMRDAIEPQYRPWKLGALLFAVLASLGLAVASVGLYGVIGAPE